MGAINTERKAHDTHPFCAVSVAAAPASQSNGLESAGVPSGAVDVFGRGPIKQRCQPLQHMLKLGKPSYQHRTLHHFVPSFRLGSVI
jgi:hypothetical protein